MRTINCIAVKIHENDKISKLQHHHTTINKKSIQYRNGNI